MQKSEPAIKQFFVKHKRKIKFFNSGKKLFIASKQISNEITRLSKKEEFLIIFTLAHFLIKLLLTRDVII